jgi:hypothetical protein
MTTDPGLPGPPMMPGQPDSAGQPMFAGQPDFPAQPLPGQPFDGQPFEGQPFAGPPDFAGQPFAGQPFSGSPFPGFPVSARRARRGMYAGPYVGPGALRAGRGVRLVVVIAALVVMAIAIGVFVNIAHSFVHSGPSNACVGGIVSGSAGQPVGNGDVRFPCTGGGSVTVHLGN